jgi:hypothetical protein
MNGTNLTNTQSLYDLATQPIDRRAALDFMNQYGFKVCRAYECGEIEITTGRDEPMRFLNEALHVKKLPVIFIGNKGRLWLLMPNHPASNYRNRDYHTNSIASDSIGDFVKALVPIVSIAYKEGAIPNPVEGIPFFVQEEGHGPLLQEFERRYSKGKHSRPARESRGLRYQDLDHSPHAQWGRLPFGIG